MTGEAGRTAPLRARDPRRLGAYELLGRLGEGGMGTVYLARDPAGTLVAVKVVRADLAPDDEFRRRFRSEVNRVRQVPPFCTAEVLDADPDHEQPYLVVEYVDGPSLADVVTERGPLTASNLHSVAIGVATALSAIHGAGVIHRDLKPRNVLLAPGSPKVIDFGIARAMEATSSHTRTDQLVGTVAYMAPERFGPSSGATLTPAADIFAWGAVVAYAGTGRTPFGADSPTATAGRILTQPPDLSGLSGPLRDLVGHTLEKDPANRPTARELLDMLVSGPHRPAATNAALAHQPGLRAAARDARAADGQAGGLTTDVPVDRDAPTRVVGPAATRPRRRRVLLPVLILGLVLLVAGSVTLVARSEGPGAWGAFPPEPVAPLASAAPALMFSDPLDAARLWEESADAKEKASCDFESGALVVRRRTPGSFRCKGPPDVEPDDLRTDVAVRLLSKGSCASVWLRFRPYLGYQVRICESTILVGTHKNTAAVELSRFPLGDAPVPIGGPATTITLSTADGMLEVLRDGQPVGTMELTDPDIRSGRVLLGIFTEPADAGHPPPYAVAFDQVDVYALS
jgi:predicted Ser/Thr protein kinase